jgi:hypothetical protein
LLCMLRGRRARGTWRLFSMFLGMLDVALMVDQSSEGLGFGRVSL